LVSAPTGTFVGGDRVAPPSAPTGEAQGSAFLTISTSVFQDGHRGALGTTSTGTLVANMPVVLFCIAFGLSMDYEVFLISRIREYWLKTASARSGASDAAQAQVMRLFGLGLTLDVVVDATLVRMVLVPAFMHVLGRWVWWAPKPLRWLHRRIGIDDEPRSLACDSGRERDSTMSAAS
jgi:uncharacterized membrane protein YdfJ with MMPL/SSD domain